MSRIEIKKIESNHKWWVKYVQWKLNQIGGNLSQILFQDMIQIESENMSLISEYMSQIKNSESN